MQPPTYAADAPEVGVVSLDHALLPAVEGATFHSRSLHLERRLENVSRQGGEREKMETKRGEEGNAHRSAEIFEIVGRGQSNESSSKVYQLVRDTIVESMHQRLCSSPAPRG